LKIEFPPEYPFKEPRVTFTTPIYHPNIDRNGNVGLKSKWAYWQTVSSMLAAICALLVNPDPYDPLMEEAAVLYVTNRNAYTRKAQKWTRKHAM
jgi:ubiquitin-conjugating enzyme E2 D/E